MEKTEKKLNSACPTQKPVQIGVRRGGMGDVHNLISYNSWRFSLDDSPSIVPSVRSLPNYLRAVYKQCRLRNAELLGILEYYVT